MASLAAKKIVLCSDGTGNSSAKSEKTNVWRLYQALDLSGPDQVGAYDDGVGTSRFKYWAIVEGAFGIGLKRNVLDLYKFACRNYPNPNGVSPQSDVPPPDIYGFGFSRGAFTIRLLVDFIIEEGLVCYRSEEELERNARAAYRNYRRKAFPAKWCLPLTVVGRAIRDLFFWIKDSALGFQPYSVVKEQTKTAGRANIRITFLGLWDTVEAYGMPVAELKDGVNKFLWPLVFGNLRLSPNVDRACHALALDDERQTFHPLLWDEASEDPERAGRITQVWFSGVHSNVGGGYPEDQLSYVSLEWILSEAKAHGLALDRGVFRQYADAKSPFARLYDSRQGLGAYYRYGPRQIALQKDHQGNDILPIIHGSVITRMVRGTDDYTSVPLPGKFWVLAPDGDLLPGDFDENTPALDATKRSPASVPCPLADPTKIAEEKATLIETIKQLPRSADRQKSVELVLDTIFWRHVLYVLTLALTFYLAAFRWTGGTFTTVVGYALKRIPYVKEVWEYLSNAGDATTRGVIRQGADVAGGLIPTWLGPWIEQLQKHPVEAFLVAASIAICLRVSSALQLRIHDLARAGWNEEFRKAYASSRKDAKRAVIVRAAIWIFVPFLGGFLAVWIAAPAWIVSALFGTSAVAAVFALFFLPRILENAEKKVMDFEATLSQNVARAVRTFAPFRRAYPAMTKNIVPALFALALVTGGALLINRITYVGLSGTKLFCRGSEKDSRSVAGPEEASAFSTDQLCWPTKLKLEQGKTYRITLTSNGDWFDRSFRTDVIGFPNSRSLIHELYAPFKRWPDANWFTPIIRVGEWGGEEYALVANKQASNSYSQCVDDVEYEKTAFYFNAPLTDESAKRLQACSPTPQSGLSVSREITPEQTGELFVYVNDAAPMLPFLTGFFSANNRGTAKIKVEPLGQNVASSSSSASSPAGR